MMLFEPKTILNTGISNKFTREKEDEMDGDADPATGGVLRQQGFSREVWEIECGDNLCR